MVRRRRKENGREDGEGNGSKEETFSEGEDLAHILPSLPSLVQVPLLP